MGKVFEGIDEALASWISAQPMWFVATAPLAPDGHVNVSPRGHDSLSILGPDKVAWVDYTGSGVETIAHVRENGSVALPGESTCEDVVRRHSAHPSVRAVVSVDVKRVSESCGYGVPVMDLREERDLLRLIANKKGPDGMDS